MEKHTGYRGPVCRAHAAGSQCGPGVAPEPPGGFTECATCALWDPEVIPEELIRPHQAGHWELCGVPVGAGDQEAPEAQQAALPGQQAPATDPGRTQWALVWILGVRSSEPGFQGHQEWDSLSQWSSRRTDVLSGLERSSPERTSLVGPA